MIIIKKIKEVQKQPYLDEATVRQIKQLEEISKSHDHISFKFELEYKLTDAREKQKQGISSRNSEFLVFDNDQLIANSEISAFGGEEPEVSGVVHPDYRRQGIFTRLIKEVEKELSGRGIETYLLIVDDKSSTGKDWLKERYKEFSHAEYEMVLDPQTQDGLSPSSVQLILASNDDIKDIIRLDQTFGSNPNEPNPEYFPEEQIKRGMEIYLVKLGEESIGKINIHFQGHDAWIFGFVINQKYRGKHLGEATIRESISLMKNRKVNHIYLQVDSKNQVAYSLYRKMGFESIYTMNYYLMKVTDIS